MGLSMIAPEIILNLNKIFDNSTISKRYIYKIHT